MNENRTFDMQKEVNGIFDLILKCSEERRVCKRKAVGCMALGRLDGAWTYIAQEHNGPSRSDNECTNEVGNCGCSHSEPRLVQSVLKSYCEDEKLILICTYSPCTTCANIVIDSGLFGGCIYDILTEHDKRGAEFLNAAMPVMSRDQMNLLEEQVVYDTLKKWISN